MVPPGPPPPEPPALTFQAASLDLSGPTLDATGVSLTWAGWRLDVGHASRGPLPGCAQGLTLEGVRRFESAQFEGVATGATLCPGGAARFTGLALRSPKFRLDAASATLGNPGPGGEWSGETVDFSSCACDDPPWHVTASAVEVPADGDAALTDPVLWAGPLPVAWVPAWRFPLARRRAGLLLPEVGYQAGAGALARLPVFLPLGESADLTPAPGYEGGGVGPTAAMRLRWATAFDETGDLRAAADRRGVAIASTGVAATERFSLATDGRFDSSLSRYDADARTPADAHALRTAGRLSARLVGNDLVLAARDTELRDRWANTRQDLPALRFDWHTAAAPLDAGLTVEDAARRGAGATENRLRFAGSLRGAQWLGPVRLALLGTGETITRTTALQRETDVLGALQGSAELGVRRAFDGLTHTVTLRPMGRLADARRTGARLPRLDLLDGLQAPTATWLEVENRLAFADGEVDVRLDGGVAKDRPRSAWPTVTLFARSTPATLDATWDGRSSLWARASALEDAPMRPRLGVTVLQAHGPDGAAFTPGPLPLVSPLQRPSTGRSTTLTPGFALVGGPVEATWDAAVLAGPWQFPGQVATIRLNGRCACWHAALDMAQVAPRAMPDLMLSVGLD